MLLEAGTAIHKHDALRSRQLHHLHICRRIQCHGRYAHCSSEAWTDLCSAKIVSDQTLFVQPQEFSTCMALKAILLPPPHWYGRYDDFQRSLGQGMVSKQLKSIALTCSDAGSFLFFLPWEGYTLVGTTDVKTMPDLHHQVPEESRLYRCAHTCSPYSLAFFG